MNRDREESVGNDHVRSPSNLMGSWLLSIVCARKYEMVRISQVAKGSDLYRADKSTKLCMVVA